MELFDYDVAISFAGEQRDAAEAIAECLASAGVNVFYDKFEDATLWGKDLYEHLSEVYHKRARHCIMLVSEAYARKLWTTHERKSAQARALSENREYILPVRFDATEIPGLAPTVGYLDFSKYGPEGVCRTFLRKAGLVREGKESATSSRLTMKGSPLAMVWNLDSKVQAFFTASRLRWGKIEVELGLEPIEPSDAAWLDALRHSTDNLILAYQLNASVCRLIDITRVGESGKEWWNLKAKVERVDFAPPMEMAYNGVSADEIATIRGRRILLDQDLSDEAATGFRDMTRDLLVSGMDTLVSVKRSPLPVLFQRYGRDPERFLEVAWVACTTLLKIAAVVEEIHRLELSLETDRVLVDFEGRRKKEYVNAPAYQVRISGVCELS